MSRDKIISELIQKSDYSINDYEKGLDLILSYSIGDLISDYDKIDPIITRMMYEGIKNVNLTMQLMESESINSKFSELEEKLISNFNNFNLEERMRILQTVQNSFAQLKFTFTNTAKWFTIAFDMLNQDQFTDENFAISFLNLALTQTKFDYDQVDTVKMEEVVSYLVKRLQVLAQINPSLAYIPSNMVLDIVTNMGTQKMFSEASKLVSILNDIPPALSSGLWNVLCVISAHDEKIKSQVVDFLQDQASSGNQMSTYAENLLQKYDDILSKTIDDLLEEYEKMDDSKDGKAE